ncbi:uncharacterized protein LOC128953176 [Oppia nitens]|uniref:uncharacterized protein LOC128953176 n=1 Tax=Oppia nitens TaxID=1686743 RepID=UPI0023DC84B5|nr:uncharacterized protein LOC128953176 [Oppia nitens]
MIQICLKFLSTISLLLLIINYSNCWPHNDNKFVSQCQYRTYKWLNCSTIGNSSDDEDSHHRELDIKQEFLELSKKLWPWARHFDQFRWRALVKGGQLPANTINNFRLIDIEIRSENLRQIHRKAFSVGLTQSGTTSLRFPGDTPIRLRNRPDSDYDIYRAFAEIPSLRELVVNLEWNSSHEIPDKAFSRTIDSRLRTVRFAGRYTIRSIGEKAFHGLRYLQELDLSGVDSIARIEDEAFELRDCPLFDYHRLVINLNGTQLADNRVENGAFDVEARRRTVTLNLDNNNFREIREKLFKKFLDRNRSNVLSLMANPLGCSPQNRSRFQWLLKNRRQYQHRLVANCATDGQSIWDYDWTERPTSLTPVPTNSTQSSSVVTPVPTGSTINGTTNSTQSSSVVTPVPTGSTINGTTINSTQPSSVQTTEPITITTTSTGSTSSDGTDTPTTPVVITTTTEEIPIETTTEPNDNI